MTNAEPLSRLIDRVKADPDVLAVIRFGSTARGDAGPASDVDVCLVLNPGRHDARTLAQKRMAYLDVAGLDVSLFQALPLYIRHRVLKEGQVVYVRDEDALYDVAYRTVQAFGDFQHIYHEYLEHVARG